MKKNIVYALRTIQKSGADLYDPETVKAKIAEMDMGETSKRIYCDRYEGFLKFLGGTLEKPRYKVTSKIPFIPLERKIDQLIAGLTMRIAKFGQIRKETGARPGEAARLKWIDIDFERRIISINDPEKGSNPRAIKVSEVCINMINQLRRKDKKLFNSLKALHSNYYLQRKCLAYKLNNPRLQKISLYTFRHWHATMLYHLTKDIIFVQQRLGHKNIKNTMFYITIEATLSQGPPEDFTVKVASTIEELTKLLEVGFEYVCDYEDKKILRKRK